MPESGASGPRRPRHGGRSPDPTPARGGLARGAPVAPGTLGIWQEGRRVAVATTTPEGECLYLDRGSTTQTTHTNVFAEVVRPWDDE
ncbi:hypothetical protein ACVU7I_11570 [Patulibacter sp. S7RM1-6]